MGRRTRAYSKCGNIEESRMGSVGSHCSPSPPAINAFYRTFPTLYVHDHVLRSKTGLKKYVGRIKHTRYQYSHGNVNIAEFPLMR